MGGFGEIDDSHLRMTLVALDGNSQKHQGTLLLEETWSELVECNFTNCQSANRIAALYQSLNSTLTLGIFLNCRHGTTEPADNPDFVCASQGTAMTLMDCVFMNNALKEEEEATVYALWLLAGDAAMTRVYFREDNGNKMISAAIVEDGTTLTLIDCNWTGQSLQWSIGGSTSGAVMSVATSDPGTGNWDSLAFKCPLKNGRPPSDPATFTQSPPETAAETSRESWKETATGSPAESKTESRRESQRRTDFETQDETPGRSWSPAPSLAATPLPESPNLTPEETDPPPIPAATPLETRFVDPGAATGGTRGGVPWWVYVVIAFAVGLVGLVVYIVVSPRKKRHPPRYWEMEESETQVGALTRPLAGHQGPRDPAAEL
jgi:hypothetical protein